MDPRDDPFVPAAGVPPLALIGRDDVVIEFTVALDRLQEGRFGAAPLITGPRGSGKTVLLNELVVRARERGWFAASEEVIPKTPLSQLIVVLAHEMLMEMSLTKRATAQVRRALGVLKAFTAVSAFGLKLNIDADAVHGTADSGLFERDLRSLFVELGEAARDQGVGILFALDEVHTLGARELDALNSALHKTAQLQLPVAFLAAGLFPSWQSGEESPDPTRISSYAGRMFVRSYVRLDPLPDEVAKEVLSAPLALRDVSIEDAALDDVISYCEGNVWLLQLVGSAMWAVAGTSPITTDDTGQAIATAQRQIAQSFLPRLLRDCTKTEIQILLALAECDAGGATFEELLGEIGEPLRSSQEDVIESIGQLARRDLVWLDYIGNLHNENFSLGFSVPRLGSYLREGS
jgi:hypothetical protein